MTKLFPAPSMTTSDTVRTLADVHRWIEGNGPAYLLQALTTLRSHLNGDHLGNYDADLGWFDVEFPKSKKGRHPRPDLGQKIAPYKKWRADCRRAIVLATGADNEKKERKARADGWADLRAALLVHTKNGGLLHVASLAGTDALADLARRAGLEPWDLRPAAADALNKAIQLPEERNTARRGLKTLAEYSFLPELAVLLPSSGELCTLPNLREKKALPDHIETWIEDVIDKASYDVDINTTKKHRTVSDDTVQTYYAALRYFLRTLRDCHDDPAHDYRAAVIDTTNDVSALFAPEHISAVIRLSEHREHLPHTPLARSIASYASTVLTVLSRAGVELDLAEIKRRIDSSKFLAEGRDAEEGMTPKKQAWCEDLLNNERKQRLFHNLHRVLQAKVQEILDAADAAGRPLTATELTKVRQAGACAAAVAIQTKGRPIRIGNVVQLRCRSKAANIKKPNKHQENWSFFLNAEETKAGKAEPPTLITGSGSDVLTWYERRIRPLFPHADESIYLFPAVESADHLGRHTLNGWFQRAAATAGLPMTFHLWRAGVATMLLDEDWNNLPIAADMLGNTVAVCGRSYAWMNPEKTIAAGQKILAARAEKFGR